MIGLHLLIPSYEKSREQFSGISPLTFLILRDSMASILIVAIKQSDNIDSIILSDFEIIQIYVVVYMYHIILLLYFYIILSFLSTADLFKYFKIVFHIRFFSRIVTACHIVCISTFCEDYHSLHQSKEKLNIVLLLRNLSLLYWLNDYPGRKERAKLGRRRVGKFRKFGWSSKLKKKIKRIEVELVISPLSLFRLS